MVSYKPLMVTLASLGMTKTQLREKAGFSTKTLAKLSKNEPVTLDIIEKYASVLDVGLNRWLILLIERR